MREREDACAQIKTSIYERKKELLVCMHKADQTRGLIGHTVTWKQISLFGIFQGPLRHARRQYGDK